MARLVPSLIFLLHLCNMKSLGALYCEKIDTVEKTFKMLCGSESDSVPRIYSEEYTTCTVATITSGSTIAPFVEYSDESHPITHFQVKGCVADIIEQGFRMFSNTLISIDISSSNLTSLEPVLMNSSFLQSLNASNNELVAVLRGLFIDAPNLREIDYSYNKLNKIDSNTFAGGEHLRTINASHNDIAYISADSFVDLTDLNFLDLKNNQIETLDFQFSNPKSLTELHLENNPLRNLTGRNNLCMGNSVERLYVSWKNVGNLEIPEGNQFEVAVNSTFEGVERTSEHNYKLYCNEHSFESFGALKANPNTLPNAKALLQFTPRLYALDLSGNFVGNLSVLPFEKIPFVQYLVLKDVKLFDLDAERLQYISHLDISFNNLRSVTNLSVLSRLESFIAAGNQFNNTQDIIQDLSTSIHELDLSDSVVSLNSSTLNRFGSLKELGLRNTSLSLTNFNPFDNLLQLVKLDISFNDLKSVNFTKLSSTLLNLWEFQCVHCQIKNVSNIIQYFGKELSVLNLSRNFIGKVNVDTFSELLGIQRLSLSNTSISNFDFNTLQNMYRFVHLDISHNKLQILDFRFLPSSIEELDFNGNDLIRMDNFNRSRFPGLKSLTISNNRFSCEYLAQLIQEWNGTFKGDPWQQKNGEDCQPKNPNVGERQGNKFKSYIH